MQGTLCNMRIVSETKHGYVVLEVVTDIKQPFDPWYMGRIGKNIKSGESPVCSPA